jgi:hypothetical protein
MRKPDSQQETRPMRSIRSRRSEGGFTFAELAFGFLILVISSAVLVNHLAVNYQTTNSERDRVFAFSKAQAILAEIQNQVDRGGLEAVDLDVLDDGTVNKPTLSIQTDSGGTLILPDHVVSGNFQRNATWLWSRRITVQPFAGVDNRNVRYVTVRVYRKDKLGIDHALADLSAVINSSGESFPTTQAYDLYLFAVENIPGWWVYMDSIRPFMESMITDLETRNPGLELRSHWITKASFGRNQLYRPYTNTDVDSTVAVPDVYVYPGRMPTGSSSAFYYVPDNIKARINVEGTERNGLSANNPHPYALADFFNHAMRYPDELALWQQRVAAVEQREADIAEAIELGTTVPDELDDMSKEPTLRLFLEDLNTSPNKYKNALIVNLHGELLPMPALRNFSDAAKSQTAFPNVRVVTHPEQLRFKNNESGVSEDLAFRMYAYAYQTSTSPYGGAVLAEPMVVEVVGLDLTDPASPTKLDPAFATLRNVPGGIPVAGVSDYSLAWQVPKHATDSPVSNEMYYRALWVPPDTTTNTEGCTRIFLFRTPIGAPRIVQAAGTFGLDNFTAAAAERSRLYQMEYVPSPVGTVVGTPSFSPDLTTSGSGPKNTARWRLVITKDTLTSDRFVAMDGSTPPQGDKLITVRTRIGIGETAGSPTWQTGGVALPTPDDPDNLSTTYTWWTDSKNDVPITERAQFNGDPRHMPYLDCVHNGDDFPNSYNWYLDNIQNGSENSLTDYRGLQTTAGASRMSDRWGAAMSCDVPRYFQLLREGLVKSNVVYSSVTGWSYYYLGIGAEIGYDSANGYPSSIPASLVPFGGTGWGYVDNILGARRFVRATPATNYWFGMPWLGELVPDDSASQNQWRDVSTGVPRGNLSAGTAGSRFYQSPSNTAYASSTRQAFGTDLLANIQRTSTYGCTTLFNIGTNASTFQHSSATTNGTLTAIGAELASNYNATVPTSVPITRPFRINASTTVAEHWNHEPYANVGATINRYSASIFQTYYSHSAGSGSAVVKLVDPSNTSAAYIVVNGIANTVTNGTTFITQFNLLALVHTMLEAGRTTNTFRIKEQPRVEIESPTDITELANPTQIDVQLAIDWVRWDGLPYTATGTFSESESELEYALLYSRDAGGTWLHVQDDSPATPGTRPDSAYMIADAGAGNETYPWDVATGFPEGTYMLRVECYRVGASSHYAYHQTRLFIQR